MSAVGLALVAFVAVTAVATVLVRDVLSAIIIFGAYSLGMALLYTLLLAPDVGLTEAAIGAGVTTILLLVTIAKTTRPIGDRVFASINWPAAAVAGILAVLIGSTVPYIPTDNFTGGLTPVIANPDVTGYYLEMTYADTGVTNAVTAVLAAYRGFDTFGEAVVVFAAGVAVLVVLHTEVFS